MTAPAASPFGKRNRKKEVLLTADDYDKQTPPDNGNYELHNGKIVFMASPLYLHQRLSNRLSYYLTGHVLNKNLGEVLAAPMDVYFDKHNVVQPDLLYISNERLSIIENNKKIKGSPDLVVEILSDSNSTKEMSFKKHLFEYFEVKEYWLINLEKQTLIQYENTEDGWMPRPILTINDTLKSIVLIGFELPLKDIFL